MLNKILFTKFLMFVRHTSKARVHYLVMRSDDA